MQRILYSIFAVLGGLLSIQNGALAQLNYTHLEHLGSNDLCLDQLGGVDLALATCSSTKESQLIGRDMQAEASAWYQFLHFRGTTVLDVSRGSRNIGGQVISWEAKSDEAANQKWLIMQSDYGAYVQIQNSNSELCLTADLADPTTPLIIQNSCCSEDINQLWRFIN